LGEKGFSVSDSVFTDIWAVTDDFHFRRGFFSRNGGHSGIRSADLFPANVGAEIGARSSIGIAYAVKGSMFGPKEKNGASIRTRAASKDFTSDAVHLFPNGIPGGPPAVPNRHSSLGLSPGLFLIDPARRFFAEER